MYVRLIKIKTLIVFIIDFPFFSANHSYMATSGLDGQMKIWDVRTYKQLQAYYTPTPASCLAISQRGLLAVGHGPNIQVWCLMTVQCNYSQLSPGPGCSKKG